jgi:hypothetical protein
MAVKIKQKKTVVIGSDEASDESVEIQEAVLPEVSLSSVAKEVEKLVKVTPVNPNPIVRSVADKNMELVNVQMLQTICPLPRIGPWSPSLTMRATAMTKGKIYAIPRFAAKQLMGHRKVVIIT